MKVQYRVLPIRYFLDFNLLCYFWTLSHNSLPAFKTLSPSTFTSSENKRTGRLDCQVRHRTSTLENCLITNGRKLWNSYFTKHLDSTSKYNYSTVKVKFKENFYELFLEDIDTKIYWKENSVGKNSVSIKIRESKL